MNPLDQWPPCEGADAIDQHSATVTLHYADGTTAQGYRCGWTGWNRFDEHGVPMMCEDDPVMPVGWTASA